MLPPAVSSWIYGYLKFPGRQSFYHTEEESYSTEWKICLGVAEQIHTASATGSRRLRNGVTTFRTPDIQLDGKAVRHVGPAPNACGMIPHGTARFQRTHRIGTPGGTASRESSCGGNHTRATVVVNRDHSPRCRAHAATRATTCRAGHVAVAAVLNNYAGGHRIQSPLNLLHKKNHSLPHLTACRQASGGSGQPIRTTSASVARQQEQG